MLTHKIASFLAWMGLFVAPATTADYNHKPLEVLCKPHKFQQSNKYPVRIKSSSKIYLKKQDEDFGGFSAALLGDKNKIYLISDRARLLEATAQFDGNIFKCLKNSVMRPLRGNSTRGLVGHYGDSEGVSFGKNQDEILVSFERAPRVIEYHLKDKSLLPHKNYPLFEKSYLPYNESYESVRMLENGDILAVTEYFVPKDKNFIRAYLYQAKKNKLKNLAIKPYKNYYITDVNILNNGDIVTLERYFSILTGISIIMRHFNRDEFLSGKVADGKVIFQQNSPEGADNFEALIVKHSEEGNWFYLISDDNFTSLQDSLILTAFYPLRSK